MDPTPIAELDPELLERDSRHFTAAVTLIWPYSSSQRQFALLLAEPDFRLRRKKGQVRARFSGSSARALATTGVGIGDEVVLSLRGAQFVKEGAVSTPGRSIDWELEYTQTVAVRILRDGNEIANIEVLDAAPTPAPRSPVRRQTNISHSPVAQWSSPAFLKRARLSDGPFLEAPYDPLTDQNADDHDKKRRRRSYKDWKAWTYSARTPSPEKENIGTEDDLDNIDASPTHRAQLPRTPNSPPKPALLSVAAGALEATSAGMDTSGAPSASATGPDNAHTEETVSGKTVQLRDTADVMQDNDYYDLYAGPNEIRPADAEYAFGGDTEANTEEDEIMEDTDAAMSSTEVDTEDVGNSQDDRPMTVSHQSSLSNRALFDPDAGSTTEGSLAEPSEVPNITEALVDDAEVNNTKTTELEFQERVEEAPMIVMPPPTLPTLNTDLPVPITPGILTPIGKEPASPTLKPLDSALLPLPSPFPGERDINITSYLDHVPTSELPAMPDAEEEEPPSDASYILENSFFSSINSSKTPALHPDHESAFTPVRFTFGMDGAGLSRPLQLSSPVPEQPSEEIDEHTQPNTKISDSDVTKGALENMPRQPIVDESLLDRDEHEVLSFTTENAPSVVAARMSDEANDRDEVPVASSPFKNKDDRLEVIDLPSDSEGEGDEAEVSEMEADHEVDNNDAVDPVVDYREPLADESRDANTMLGPEQVLSQERIESTTINPSTAVSEVVDLGSPSDSSGLEGPTSPSSDKKASDATSHEAVTLLHTPSVTQDQGHLPEDPPFVLENLENHSELSAMDFMHANLEFRADTLEIATTHPEIRQVTQSMTASGEADQLMTNDHDFPSVMDNLDTIMDDNFLHDEHLSVAQWVATDLDEHHPDIKIESIEERSIFQSHELDTQPKPDAQDGRIAEPSGEILIDIPDEGDKLGELHTISVPATGPARNTRSKTKAPVSPTMERVSPPKRTARSTRPKASMTPIAPRTMSPSGTQTRSTMSPSQELAQTSPYSLRSQSKFLSPTQGTFVGATNIRRSPRKHVSQRDVDSTLDISSSQLQDADAFITSFEPSQELGASQGQFSTVGSIKDSEEETLHSEQSLSTVKYSDDWNTFTNFSDPPVENEQTYNVNPPPASASEAGATGQVKQNQRQAVVPDKSSPAEVRFSFTTHTSLGSPNTKLRSASSTEISPDSSRVRRTTRQSVNLLSSPAQRTAEFSDEATPKTKRLLPGESKGNELQSSPIPSAVAETEMRSSPPAAAVTLPTLDPQSIANKNRPITPEATQQTDMASQNSIVSGQQKQSLLMTPQPTQATSVDLQSFEGITANDTTLIGTPSKRSPNVITRSTPRQNATQTDVASLSVTPKKHSSDASSDGDSTAVESSQGPSIGLSTPVAYYTPLKSLTFFLNRSSQFHTSSNPDVLALVTSATTPPQRATKGRKDWTTSLHITDASTWPSTTTVNIFRPYQTALPSADAGDVILLNAFAVKSLNRHPTLTSADESSWCVWRYNKPVWGVKRGAYAELKAREEVKGPAVERGEGEWREVEKLRMWWVDKVKSEMEEKVHTRSMDKAEEKEESGVQTRSRDKGKGVSVVEDETL